MAASMYCHSHIQWCAPMYCHSQSCLHLFIVYWISLFTSAVASAACVLSLIIQCDGVLVCIVQRVSLLCAPVYCSPVSQPVAIAATLSIRDFLPRHTLSCHFFVRFLIFLFPHIPPFPHIPLFPQITPHNNYLAIVPYILRGMMIQHISVQGSTDCLPCDTLSCHFFVCFLIFLPSRDL